MIVPFDYTDAEWLQICDSVRGVRKEPLPKTARKRLIVAAQDYLSGVKAAERNDHERDFKKRWEKINKLAEELRDKTLTETQQISGPIAELLTLHTKHVAWITNNIVNCDTNEKIHPRLLYQARVIEVWVALGGKLQISRNSRSKKVQGPLSRYFFAVTRPVMGDFTPSPESLRDIVNRQKNSVVEVDLLEEPKSYSLGAIYHWLRAYLARVALRLSKLTAVAGQTVVAPEVPAMAQDILDATNGTVRNGDARMI